MAVEVATIKKMQDLQRELAALRAELTQQADCAPTVINLPTAGRWEHVLKRNEKRVKFGLFNLARSAPRSVIVPNPAAGSDWAQAVPAGQRWRIQSVRETFTTSAQVATRNTSLLIDDGINPLYQVGNGGTTQLASLTVTYHYAPGVPQFASWISQQISPLPVGLVLLAGHRVLSSTNSIQTGDTFTAIAMLIEDVSPADMYWSNKAEQQTTIAGVPIFGIPADPTDPYLDRGPWVYGGDVFVAGVKDAMQVLAIEWTRP
ncbi:MAG TPA: hypothetical protein VGA58_13685 [bacterium]